VLSCVLIPLFRGRSQADHAEARRWLHHEAAEGRAEHEVPPCGKVYSAAHGAGYAKGDDIVDLYLAGSGRDKAQRRIELADTFHDQTQPSERRDMIYVRILRRIIP
jgi:hypothetical protein